MYVFSSHHNCDTYEISTNMQQGCISFQKEIASAAAARKDWTTDYNMVLSFPDNKVYGANMGPIWGRQDPGGPNVGPMNLATWGIVMNWV